MMRIAKMKMKKLCEIFDVRYGVNLDLNSLTICRNDNKNAVNFVSRTAQNNGVSAIVERIAGLDPLPAGTISVAGGGSVLEAFLQPKPYYSGRDLFYLTPIKKMADLEKLYYCECIKANKYKYNYGRQANKTLRDILIPDVHEIPDFIATTKTPDYSNVNKSKKECVIDIDTALWTEFYYSDIFTVKKGKRVTYYSA